MAGDARSYITNVNFFSLFPRSQRSITADCIALGNEIAKVSLALNGFVRDVREARLDVDAISRELHSLQGVLDLLKEDASLFPLPLAAQTPAVLDNCSKVVGALDMCFATLNSSELPRQEKRRLWAASGRKDAALFKPVIEAHRALIGIALDLVEAYVLLLSTGTGRVGKRQS